MILNQLSYFIIVKTSEDVGLGFYYLHQLHDIYFNVHFIIPYRNPVHVYSRFR